MNRKARRAAQAQGAVPQASPRTPAVGIATAEVQRANQYLADGDFDFAIDSYVKAIEIQPDLIEAHAGLCRVMLMQGKPDLVIEHVQHILAISAAYMPGHNILALAYLRAGRPQQALDAVLNGLRRVEAEEGKLLFIQALQQSPAFVPSDEVRRLAVRALSEPWCRPTDLAAFCVNTFKADRPLMTALTDAAAGSIAAYRVLAGNALLCGLLENACVPDATLEHALTALRAALLRAATDSQDDPARLAFACTLARQCFINEYIYAVTPVEERALDTLRETLVTALRADAPVAPASLAVFATYAALDTIGEDERLLARRWPAPVEALLQQQVREPAEERRLRDTIPCLTPIEDGISVLVREQYEQNPYPRWIKAPAVHPYTVDALLRGRFPHAGFRSLGPAGAVDLLVAGCGTGQQVVEIAQRIVNTRALAIDLSLSSLAYAKRQIAELGLANIEFGQADILELGALGRQFDVIDCGGVLHHLYDPLAGWRVLLSLLRPNGVMRVALYSERARRNVVAARAMAAGGYPADPAGIRRFRQDVLALPEGDAVTWMARSPDFYSLSACRDLAFHVQECRFTLPQIKEFLAETRLNLLGFDLEDRSLDAYKMRFPDDLALNDLDRWDVVEQAHPDTFTRMYQFWVQKQA